MNDHDPPAAAVGIVIGLILGTALWALAIRAVLQWAT